MEKWIPVVGFEGYYEVSDKGRVRSLPVVKEVRNRWGKIKRTYGGNMLSASIDPKTGYEKVILYKDGKPFTRYVHRIVASAFLKNEEDLPQVNHKDEVKTNNNVENLEWCSAKYNMNYGTARKRMSEAQGKKVVQIIDGKEASVFCSIHEAGRKTGVNFKNIQSVCSGKRKTAGGFEWRYVG